MNQNKLTNQQNSSLDNLSLELSELEMESISGGMTPYLPPNVVEFILKDSCKHDPDSARLPDHCWRGSLKS